MDALDITQGEIHDEDITITITDELGSGWWDQKLSALEAPILYREGDPGTWTRTTTINTDIVIFNGVVPQVNYPTGTDWNLEDVGVSRYFAYWVIASSDTNFPIFLVPGQEDGSSAADAIENNNLSDMDFGDLPSAEHKVIARIILQRQNLSPYIRIEQIDDYRGVSDEPKTGGGAVSNDHGNLLGLSDDDHLQYALANGTRAFTTNAAVGVLLVDTGNNNFGSTANASVIISGEDHTLNMTRGAIIAGSTSTMNAATTQNSGIFVGNTNQISANDAVICGGADHFILGDYGFIGGGKDNDIGVNGVRAGMVGSSNSTANGYNNGMVGTYNSTTNGDQASILGGEDHTLNGTDSVIVGGQGCTVNDSTNSAILSSINSTLAGSSDSSIICGGQNHSVTANNAASLIAGGLDNTVNGDNSAVIAGYDNTANADQAAILAGQDNIVDEDNSVILGGYDCLTEKQNTVTYGKYAVNEHWGAFVHTGGRQNSDGDCQVIRGNMSAYTTNGVTADLTLDAIHAATTGNKLIMPENSIWYMTGGGVATNNIGNYGCVYAVHTCLQRNGSNQPVYMGLGTASANPTYYLLFEDNVNFNIGVAIQSGAVITITCTQPGISQSFKWNCAIDISQVIGGLYWRCLAYPLLMVRS